MAKQMAHTRTQLEHLRNDLGKLSAVIGDLLEHQVKSTEQTGHMIEEKVEAGAEWVEEQVKERPAHAVGIAVGVGFLLGVMAMRRH